MKDAKARLREQARGVRRAIPPEARAQKSARIAEHVLGLPELRQARAVGCYVSVASEVDTGLLVRRLLVADKVVAVPAMVEDELRFVRLDHPWALVPGPRGIPVPREPWREVSGDALAVVLVPGLQFGRDGSRLGQGGGYFDRWLHAHVTPLRVGLAFSEQVVDSVPLETHDEAMDVVVTEEGRFRIGRQG